MFSLNNGMVSLTQVVRILYRQTMIQSMRIYIWLIWSQIIFLLKEQFFADHSGQFQLSSS